MANADVFEAVSKGDMEALRRHLAADPELSNARNEQKLSLLMWAAYHRRPDMVEMIALTKGDLDLFEAALAGKLEVVRQRLEQDAASATSLSEDGFTALHYAAFFGHDAVAKLLIEKGADVNALSRNAMSLRPLHTAAAFKSIGVARHLVERGADVNATSPGGFTPLHAAANNGDADLIRLLLKHHANVGAKTDEGKTAAEIAHERGHHAAADQLIPRT